MSDEFRTFCALGAAGAAIGFGVTGTAQGAALGFGIEFSVVPAALVALMLLYLILP